MASIAEKINVAAIQMACSPDLSANRMNAENQIRTAAEKGAKIICLQELFHSRYFCQTECHDHFALAESIPGPTTKWARSLSIKLNIVIIVPVFERRAPGLFHNSAVVCDSDGSIAGTYQKMHIPDDPNFYEKFYFAPGESGFKTINTSMAKIGVCICWDQWFPEAARATALSGAEILFYPTAIGWLTHEKESFGNSQLSSWQIMMRSHAIANGIFVVAANRLGLEDNIDFWGSSFIANPYGEVISQASTDRDEIVLAECDLNLIEVARTHWPFFRDRRIDAYGVLNQRFAN